MNVLLKLMYLHRYWPDGYPGAPGGGYAGFVPGAVKGGAVKTKNKLINQQFPYRFMIIFLFAYQNIECMP